MHCTRVSGGSGVSGGSWHARPCRAGETCSAEEDSRSRKQVRSTAASTTIRRRPSSTSTRGRAQDRVTPGDRHPPRRRRGRDRPPAERDQLSPRPSPHDDALPVTVLPPAPITRYDGGAAHGDRRTGRLAGPRGGVGPPRPASPARWAPARRDVGCYADKAAAESAPGSCSTSRAWTTGTARRSSSGTPRRSRQRAGRLAGGGLYDLPDVGRSGRRWPRRVTVDGWTIMGPVVPGTGQSYVESQSVR